MFWKRESKSQKKARSTRWLQHKSWALKSLITGYPAICANLKSMASEESSVKPADNAYFTGYLKRLISFKFVPIAITSLKAFHLSLQTLQEDDPENPSELLKLIASVEKQDHQFHGVKLSGVQPRVLAALNSSRSDYIQATQRFVDGRFDDLQNVFKQFVCLTQNYGILIGRSLQPSV